MEKICFKVKTFKLVNGLNVKNNIITILENVEDKFKVTINNSDLPKDILLDKNALKKLIY